MDIKHFLKEHAYLNIPLTYEEGYELGQLVLVGCQGHALAQIQSIAALSALHNKATYAWTPDAVTASHYPHQLPSSAAEQIAGICAAVFELDIAKSRFGFFKPNVACAMDNAGMGGDLVVTANVSTIAALIAATDGIAMCKHGSPSNADRGRHGSSDFVALLGIDASVEKAVMERCVEEEGFGYIEALDTRYKHIHSQTHTIAKLPHMNDIIGPITSPLHPSILTKRIVGVNQLIPPRVVAEAYQILNEKGITNMQHGLFVRGFSDEERKQGIDEISICAGGTQVAELKDGEIREFQLRAEDFGLDVVSQESISPPHGMSKGEFSLRILRQEVDGEALQMVLANTAPLYVLSGRAETYREGYLLAKKMYESGRVWEKVARIQNVLGRTMA